MHQLHLRKPRVIDGVPDVWGAPALRQSTAQRQGEPSFTYLRRDVAGDEERTVLFLPSHDA